MAEEISELDQVEKRYGHLLVVAFCVATLLVVLGLAIGDHWFNQRLLSDFWPIDKSTVAPNILASIIIFDVVTLAAALFYPPFKHALDAGLSKHVVGPIHKKLDAQHQERLDQAERHHLEHLEQAAKHHKSQLQAINRKRKSNVRSD
jgi:hypothetical protein